MGAAGMQAHSHFAMDAVAWFANVASAVTIVFVNKVLMDSRKGYAFTFACTLSAIHFLTAAACVIGAQTLGLASKAKLPWRDTLYFSVVAVISIASLNLSLLVNPVGLYQVAKLLVIPFVCMVEAAWFGRRFNAPTLLSIATVIAGVAIVTVNDLGTGSSSALGVMIAAVSVVGSGMQQILCGAVQRQHKLASHQLLAATAPVQGAMLLVIGPWVDAAVSGNWVASYPITTPALAVLLLSCAISVGVNVSQFMCLGRFSAVTFQVLGHTKTILVLLISWLALGELMTQKKLFGLVLAVAGMIAYGAFIAPAAGGKPSKPPGAAKEDAAAHADPEQGKGRRDGGPEEPLLRVSTSNSWANESVVVVSVERGQQGGK